MTAKLKCSIKSTIFWVITPCIPLRVNRRFGGTYRLHFQRRQISRARNQRENRWQADQSASRQRTIRRYIPEDVTLHNHRCENFKSYKVFHVKWTIMHRGTALTQAADGGDDLRIWSEAANTRILNRGRG
jgi:hypothetical protein